MKPFGTLAFLTLLSVAAPGQTFTAADVHPSPQSNNPNVHMTGGVLHAGRYDLRKATMLDLIGTAYGIDDPAKVLGGPNWLELDRFDIVAKVPPATSSETLKLMLQSLLADRFKLVIHKDTKPMPAFVLSPGKGKPKLREAAAEAGTGCQGALEPNAGAMPVNHLACRGVTMEAFARALHDSAGAYLANPVVDSTGLKGAWDFDLRWTPPALMTRAGSDGITLYDAVDKQLGLKLEPQKAPASVIVVDSVNEKPTDNPPDLATSLPPPPPAEYEVAEIKPSLPDSRPNAGIQPGGRVDITALTLKSLIQFAWDIDFDVDERIVGGPKFLDTDRFDMVAKASTTTSGPASALQVDMDDLRLMMRALLVDRFKLATHMEDRPVDAYTLLAAKPKLTKADPVNRTGCKEGPASASNLILARSITCLNITMAQFADMLPSLANTYVHTAVLDETGIEGAWDFTVNFSPIGLLRAPMAAQPGADPSAASDPSGALSLPDALNKQLGLKLDLRKRPIPVLVIDHVEQKPIAN